MTGKPELAGPVLVADDQPLGRAAIARALTNAGITVLEADGGTEALRLMRSHHPPLALLDVVMPDRSGLEVLREVKTDPLLAETTVVLLSAQRIDPGSQAEGLDAGADGYIARPISNLELVARVRALLRQHELTTRLRQSEARVAEQAALIDEANDAIMVRDLEHRIRFCNRGAARLYGWPREELMGQLEPEALFQDPQAFHQAVAVFETDGEWTGELVQQTRAGSPVTVLSRWTPLCDAQGRPSSVLAISTDISERKVYERQMLRAQRMESVGTLAGGIAHDLNNVLTPILMSVNMLREGERDPARLQTLDLVATSAQRGAEMVRQVLSFARGFEGSRVPVDVLRLVHDVAKIAHETMLKAIDIQVELPSHLRQVQGDTTQLEQVLLNLCVNARDAMPDGGRLLLKAEEAELDSIFVAADPGAAPGHHVVLTVEDTGTGMPPEVLDRIFDPFFTTKEQGKGTGLGLSTSQAIVKSHGGFVRVTSEPGRGSSFRVYLPATAGRDPETRPSPRAEHPRGGGEVILVVDDEPAIREITRRTLEAYGYQVLTAADGAAAIALYSDQHERVAAVLTDMMMPGMGGREMIEVLHRINPEVRVVAASGLSSARDLPAGMHTVVGPFLQKPYTAAELLNAIRTVLEGS